jgi:UDP-N-acetylmuramoyl-tripeptide--D-alanyl-D-alanine ligase
MSRAIFHISDLFELTGAVIYNPDSYKSVSSFGIDSRKIKKGSIFVAIRGKNFDGHNFVKNALNNGAQAVIIDQKRLGEFDDIDSTIVTVLDTVKAFGELAKVKRVKLNYTVTGITGSNGKTSTKEFASQILSEKFKVTKTSVNNNNHIGVPLTISEAKLNDKVLVLELGTNHPGEIKYTAEIAQPNVALITNIGQAHLQYLKDRESVLEEKSALFETTAKRDGKILLNTDDPLLKKLKRKYKNVTTFGFKGKPDIKGKVIEYDRNGYPTISVAYKNKALQFKPYIIGDAALQNIFNGVVIALALGLNKKEILSGIKKLKNIPGRFDVINFEKFVLIDDTYNSSPESILAGIRSIKRIKSHKQKIVILGDIFELGKRSEEIHRGLAEGINKLKPTLVLTLGKMMRFTSEGLSVENKHFTNIRSLLSYIRKMDFDNSVIFVKGSRGMKMERVVEFIKETEN